MIWQLLREKSSAIKLLFPLGHRPHQKETANNSIRNSYFSGGGFGSVLSDVSMYVIRSYSEVRLRRRHSSHYTEVKAGVGGTQNIKGVNLDLVAYSSSGIARLQTMSHQLQVL